MSGPEDPRYVRFGVLPRGGRSRNYRKWSAEEGVSAYPGTLRGPDRFFIDTSELSVETGIAGLLAVAAADYPAFFLAGFEVGRGSDGEPLLRVERCWRVPRSVSITSYAAFAQPALGMWSRGPRDGSGHKHTRRRLTGDTGYVPEGFGFHALAGLDLMGTGTKHTAKTSERKRKLQKQARKKQRGGKKK